MTRIYIADTQHEERSALRALLLDLDFEVVGEADDWLTVLAQVPVRNTDILLVDWDLLPDVPSVALAELRQSCPKALVVVLIGQLSAREQAALSAGADEFISKDEPLERIAERLHTIIAKVMSIK